MSNKKLYEHNRELLNNYRWWSATNGELSAYEEVRRNIKDDVKVIRTETYTRPFFLNLDNPLLLKDELNTYHLEYVVDNVRRSEDFGGDNHIYLYYSYAEMIYAIMMEYDLSRILEDDKVFFLIGEDNFKSSYPYDFLANEGIDYDSMESKPIRVEEIQRIIIDNPTSYFSGNIFMAGILDAHPNLLTLKGLGGSELGAIYEEVFLGRTITEARKALENTRCEWILGAFRIMFFCRKKDEQEAIYWGPKWEEFWRLFEEKCNGKAPDEGTFIRAFYLAYDEAIWGTRNSRIAPAIRVTTHCNSTYIVRNMQKESIRQTFSYRREIGINRNPVIRFASELTTEMSADNWVLGSVTFPLINWEPYEERYFAAKWVRKDELSDDVRLIRFEDLKLHSLEALKSLCVFIDIPFDVMMWYTTDNGYRSSYYSPGSKRRVSDFDPKPATDYKKNYMSKHDIYRLELLFEKELEEEGYRCLEYDGKKYSDKEILRMFEEPFLIYQKRQDIYGLGNVDQFRRTLHEYVGYKLAHPSNETESGERLYHVPFLDVKKGAEVFDSLGGQITEEEDAVSAMKGIEYYKNFFEEGTDGRKVYAENYFSSGQGDIELMLEKKKEIENRIKGNYKKVFLYGAGADGRLVGKQLREVLVGKEAYYVDKDSKLWEKEIAEGIICKPFDVMFGCGEDAIIIISSSKYCYMIKKYLKQDSMQTTKRLKGIMIEDEYCIICTGLRIRRAL